jgi:pimeloyl-ACP methyl ester carboxylesterase
MRLLRAVVLVPLLLLPLLIGCRTEKTPSQPENPKVQPEKVALKQRRAIVFVHGIHGTSDDTWRVSPSGPYWPDMMKTDSQFADADILALGYPSPFVGNKSDVKDIANSLAEKLKPVFANHDQVVFLCHSLGGLIVKEMLLTHSDFAKKVPAIVFFATPHGGSVVAAYASVFLDDPFLEVMKGEGGDTYIWNLAQRWRATKLPIHSYCVFEKEKMRPHDLSSILIGGTPNAASKLADFIGGIYVVNVFSATYDCDNNGLPFEGIDGNHITLVKPPTKGVGGYALFSKYYSATEAPPKPVDQIITYDKVICAIYGEANQQQPAWNNDFQCNIPDAGHLDHDYRQPSGSSAFAGGGASTDMTMASVPSGFDVIADGAYYWSIRAPSFGGDTFTIHTYCGPSGGFAGGCNVKTKIVAHYKVNVTQEARQPVQ